MQERKWSRRARERGRRDPFLFFAPARPCALALAVGPWPTWGWATSLLVGFGPFGRPTHSELAFHTARVNYQ